MGIKGKIKETWRKWGLETTEDQIDDIYKHQREFTRDEVKRIYQRKFVISDWGKQFMRMPSSQTLFIKKHSLDELYDNPAGYSPQELYEKFQHMGEGVHVPAYTYMPAGGGFETQKLFMTCRDIFNDYLSKLKRGMIEEKERSDITNTMLRSNIVSSGKANKDNFTFSRYLARRAAKQSKIRMPKMKQPKPPHFIKVHHARRGSGITRRSDR